MLSKSAVRTYFLKAHWMVRSQGGSTFRGILCLKPLGMTSDPEDTLGAVLGVESDADDGFVIILGASQPLARGQILD